MSQALSHHLAKAEFQLYCTLTFGPNWNAKKSRNKVDRLFSWLREVYQHHTGNRDLADPHWLAAEELGEMGERYHLHLCLGSLPPTLSKNDLFAIAWLWREEFKGGFAQVRFYDPRLAGVSYCLKCVALSELRLISSAEDRERAALLSGSNVGHSTSYAGANAYELAKIGDSFDKGLTVMFSHGLLAWLAERANSRFRRKSKSLRFLRGGNRSKRKTPVTHSKNSSLTPRKG